MSGKQTDFDILMEHDIDIRGRTIYLDGDVERDRISKFQKLIRWLDKTDGAITVVLDSDGGDVSLGFKAYDEIKARKNHVIVMVCGVAMSMGSIILQAGDERIITANSKIMIHRGDMGIEGHFTNVERAVADNKDMDRRCVDIYLDKIREVKPTFKRSQVEKMMDFDTYISAERALELGLVDDIEEES